jgi:hypothetical protein
MTDEVDVEDVVRICEDMAKALAEVDLSELIDWDYVLRKLAERSQP